MKNKLPEVRRKSKVRGEIKFIDLFCGMGGFRIAAEKVLKEIGLKSLCVFSSDIDLDAQKIYQTNFEEAPAGDITTIHETSIPDHDILFAGFPCQSFSICGKMKGFEDVRGTLFFHIARILKEKRPRAFVLENVKMLANHDGGRTLATILNILTDLGYNVWHQVLNALDFGLPQNRERIFIVGTRMPDCFSYSLCKVPMQPLIEVLERNVEKRYFASSQIRENRQVAYRGPKHVDPMIWHENKSGNISAYPYSCAMRAGASYNYLLVNGERRLTEREMLRLQGFPDSYKVVGSYSIMRKLAGNSLPVPCAASVIKNLINSIFIN
ncbi:MAG: DNA (cytosine-5-)-methyltransferase [Verrucomicrobia bacterium]|nr:DNA (cytosine-5-)-methyltransferase [Verrucomicrobiota bacterium]